MNRMNKRDKPQPSARQSMQKTVSGMMRRFSALLRRLDNARTRGRFDVACRTLVDLAGFLFAAQCAHFVVDLRQRIVGEEGRLREASPTDWGCFLNYLGLALEQGSELHHAAIAFEECLAVAEEGGDDDLASTALQNLGVVSYETGQHDAARKYYEDSLKLKIAIGDHRGTAQIQSNLASMSIEEGDIEAAESLLNSSLQIKQAMNDRQGLIVGHSLMGLLAVKQFDYVGARKHYSRSLRLARSHGGAREVANSCLGLGNVLVELGDSERAFALYREGLDIARKARMIDSEEMLLKALAVGLSRMGQYQEAHSHFILLAKMERKLKRTFDEAMAYHDAAVVSAQAGEVRASIALYQRAVRCFRRAGDDEWRARCLWEMANEYALSDETDQSKRAVFHAIRLLRRRGMEAVLLDAYQAGVWVLFMIGEVESAARMFRQEQDLLARAGELQNLGQRLREVASLFTDYGVYRRGISLLHKAVSVYRDLGEPALEALALNDLALTYADYGRLEMARSMYEDLAARAEIEQNRVLQLLCLPNLAEVVRRMGEPELAVVHGNKGLVASQEIQDSDVTVRALHIIGLAYEDLGDLRKARSCFNNSLRLARRVDNPEGMAHALNSLGVLHCHRGHYEKAVSSYDEALEVLGKHSNPRLRGHILANKTIALIAAGQDDEASSVASDAIAQAQSVRDYDTARHVCNVTVDANLAAGSVEGAASALAVATVLAALEGTRAVIEVLSDVAALVATPQPAPYDKKMLHEAFFAELSALLPGLVSTVRDILDPAIDAFHNEYQSH